jgi:predicted N-formylglutamate amidohydrolase
LLGPNDPPPVEIFNRDGAAPVVFICDHASAALPESLGLLGLHDDDFTRHIAIDIGAAPLTRQLARHFGGQAVLAGYSRLVIDCNRVPDDHTSIREISEHTVIAGNRNLSPADRERRVDSLFRPYHAAVAGCIEGYTARGITPAIVAIHSFTPVYRGLERPWHVGILSNRDRRLADPLIAALSRDDSLVVGDNQPYSGLAFAGYTIEVHAIAAGLPNVMIEVRQDLVTTDADVARWVGILQEALAPILEDPALYSTWEA